MPGDIGPQDDTTITLVESPEDFIVVAAGGREECNRPLSLAGAASARPEVSPGNPPDLECTEAAHCPTAESAKMEPVRRPVPPYALPWCWRGARQELLFASYSLSAAQLHCRCSDGDDVPVPQFLLSIYHCTVYPRYPPPLGMGDEEAFGPFADYGGGMPTNIPLSLMSAMGLFPRQ